MQYTSLLEKMKQVDIGKRYMISRGVLCALTFFISFLVFLNENMKTRLIATISFTVVSFFISFITTPISKKIIARGNAIATKGRRMLFYILLFPVVVIFLYVLWSMLYFLMENGNTTNPQTFSEALGQAILELFVMISALLLILVPYIQTLIVLLLGKLMKK